MCGAIHGSHTHTPARAPREASEVRRFYLGRLGKTASSHGKVRVSTKRWGLIPGNDATVHCLETSRTAQRPAAARAPRKKDAGVHLRPRLQSPILRPRLQSACGQSVARHRGRRAVAEDVGGCKGPGGVRVYPLQSQANYSQLSANLHAQWPRCGDWRDCLAPLRSAPPHMGPMV